MTTQATKIIDKFSSFLWTNDIEAEDTSESECDDYRFDFAGEMSVWIRSDGTVEGALPKKYKTKFNAWAKLNKLHTAVRFV